MARKKTKRTNKPTEKKGKEKKKKIEPKKIIAGIIVLVVIILIITKLTPEKDTPIAEVNGEKIYVSEFQKKYNVLPEESITPEEFLDVLVDESLLLQQVKALNIIVSKTEVDLLMESTITQSGISKDIFFERAAERGLTKEDLREAFETRLLIKRLFDQVLVIEINESELVEFFEANKDQLISPERVNARHILVSTKEEADEIRAQLIEGADFENVVKEKSLDTGSAEQGGKLGWFTRGQMVPPFEHVAFSLRTGAISPPVKTEFGWHIIEILGKKSETALKFEEVKEDLAQLMYLNKREAAAQEYLNTLRTNGSIEKISSEELTTLLQQ